MDRLAGELIGLPIVTLDDGRTLARVEDMLVDPGRRQVLALIVQEKGFGRPARAIPFGRISASGPDALVVQNAKVTLDVDRDPVLKGLDNGQSIQGVDVMTDAGRKIGKVSDMLIDDRTGEIKSFEVKSGDSVQRVPADGTLSLGKDILYLLATSAASTVALDVSGVPDAAASRVTIRRKGVKDEGQDVDEAGAGGVYPAVDNEPAGAGPSKAASAMGTSDLANIMGGNTVNTRLLFGIVILVLGILILVYPNLLPLIAGISLIVIGLWVALQNAAGARP